MADAKEPKQSRDEVYAQLRYMQNAYSQQYELLEDQIATYSLSLDALRKSHDFLKNVSSVENRKTLISLGGGIYTEAQLGKANKMMVYIGSGYIIEKNVADSSAYIEEYQTKQQELLSRMDAERKKLQAELMSIAYKLESMQQQ